MALPSGSDLLKDHIQQVMTKHLRHPSEAIYKDRRKTFIRYKVLTGVAKSNPNVEDLLKLDRAFDELNRSIFGKLSIHAGTAFLNTTRGRDPERTINIMVPVGYKLQLQSKEVDA